MKVKILAGLAGALILGAGCVGTVNDRSTAAVPFVKDKLEGRYERSVPQVFEATKTVLGQMGTVSREATSYAQTNAVRVVEAKVNKRAVWVRIQAVDPNVTAVIVQARTSGGGTDMNLVHEIDKRIALQLTTR